MHRGVRHKLCLVLMGVLGLPGSARAQNPQNWKRLEAMPLEQRQSLARALDEFDLLPPDEQSAIRTLDAEISKLDPQAQARYRETSRRYHIWVQGLDETRKKELEKADTPDSKLALIDKWKKADKEHAGTSGKENLVLGVHPGDLGMAGPFEMANALKVWMVLDAKERARIESLDTVKKRMEELVKTGREEKLITVRRFLPAEEEKYRSQIVGTDQGKEFRKAIAERAEKAEKAKAEKAEKAKPKKAEAKVEVKKTQLANRDQLHHIAESLYFMDHPPAPVTREHLVQFEAELPTWFRSSLDPLSPEDAKRRLTMLYRQIYEPPNEIKPSKKPDPAKPAEKPKAATPRPAAPIVPL